MVGTTIRQRRRPIHTVAALTAALVMIAIISPPPPARAAAASEPSAAIDQAVWSAADRGPTPIIVEYRTSAAAATTNAADDGPRKAQIADAAARVLSSLPAGSASGVQRAGSWPMLATVADRNAVAALAASPDVVRVMPNRPHTAALSASVPKIGGPVAYAAGFTGAGQTVAVLDTGVDSSHPFLAGKIVEEACFSSDIPTVGVSPVCPGADPTMATGPGSAAPCPTTDCGHGTHVAGIAAGNGSTETGVAKDANIIAVQVFSKVTNSSLCGSSSPCARYWDFDLVRGLDYVYGLRSSYSIAAANMSLGGFFSTGYCDFNEEERPFSDLRAAGIAPVVAAGNDGIKNGLGIPACSSNAVSVGATNKLTDDVGGFSNSNQYLTLLAPGISINSSVPGGGFANLTGTSMATPHVVGAFALLKQQHPDWSVADITSLLRATGLPIIDPGNNLAVPRVRLDGAVRPPTFHPLTPARAFDTRTSGVPLGPGETIDVQLAGVGGVPAVGVSAVVVNLTGVSPTVDTHLTMYPASFPLPASSNLNLRAGETRANQAVVKLGANGVASIRNNSGSSHVVVDIAGYLDDGGTNDSGDHFEPMLPQRIADTRSGTGGVPVAPIGPGGTLDVDVASACPSPSATAAVMNLTITNNTEATHLTMFPTGTATPLVSNVNVPASSTAPNLATVALGGGKVTVFNNAGTADVIVDLFGCYAAGPSSSTAGRFVPVEPSRIVDTRSGLGVPAPGKLVGNTFIATAMPVAGRGGAPTSGMKAAIVNLTGTNNEQYTHLTVAPTGMPVQQLLTALNTSVLNLAPGQTAANLVQVPVGADGKFLVANASGATDVAIDLVGWIEA